MDSRRGAENVEIFGSRGDAETRKKGRRHIGGFAAPFSLPLRSLRLCANILFSASPRLRVNILSCLTVFGTLDIKDLGDVHWPKRSSSSTKAPPRPARCCSTRAAPPLERTHA